MAVMQGVIDDLTFDFCHWCFVLNHVSVDPRVGDISHKERTDESVACRVEDHLAIGSLSSAGVDFKILAACVDGSHGYKGFVSHLGGV